LSRAAVVNVLSLLIHIKKRLLVHKRSIRGIGVRDLGLVGVRSWVRNLGIRVHKVRGSEYIKDLLGRVGELGLGST
jgi:hypothetical protein